MHLFASFNVDEVYVFLSLIPFIHLIEYLGKTLYLSALESSFETPIIKK